MNDRSNQHGIFGKKIGKMNVHGVKACEGYAMRAREFYPFVHE